MRLIVEADGGGDVGRRRAPENEAAGGVDATADHVGMRAQAELAGEAPHQMGDAALEGGGRPGQADIAGEVIVEELPELPGDAWLRRGNRARSPGQMAGDPLSDPREPRLRVQGFRPGRRQSCSSESAARNGGSVMLVLSTAAPVSSAGKKPPSR